MTLVVNLFGGPGTGKTNEAARLFTYLKDIGCNAEHVQEWVKTWAWEERKPVNFDQFYIFGQQARREYLLYGKVDVIVTDCPAAIGGYYAKVFGSPAQSTCFDQMTRVFYDMAAIDEVAHLNVFLRRVKPYNPKGRFQNEAEAIAIDKDMKQYLTNTLGMPIIECDGNKDGTKQLFKQVLDIINKDAK